MSTMKAQLTMRFQAMNTKKAAVSRHQESDDDEENDSDESD